MRSGDGLVLRDIHPGVAPSWWPPAPGWWLLATACLAVAVLAGAWLALRRRRRLALARLFDQALAEAASPAEELAAMSELLRRAARRRDPAADVLEGEAWLRLLDDGLPQPVFAGSVLGDGAFRRDVPGAAVAALRPAARARFLQWMGAR